MSSETTRAAAGRAALLAVLAALAGCGRPAGVIFEPTGTPIVWPPPPDPARVQYVGQLESSADLKPARSFFDQLGATIFGAEGARSMLTPYAVAVDARQRVFVCDSNAQLVHVFDLETRRYERWRPEEDQAALAQPVGVAVLPGGGLLVSDAQAGSLFAFDDRGAFLGELAGEHLARPCGLAVDGPRGRVVVADSAAHQVLVLDLDGRLLERVGTRGTGPGEFNFPTNVAVDGSGRLYVADTLNFRVQVFDADLRFVSQIGRQGDMPGFFSHPKGLALDSDGHLYVVDSHFESVQIFDAQGRLLLTYGGEGHGPGEFWLPAGLHIDASDRIWIADSYNRRVQVFQYRKEGQP